MVVAAEVGGDVLLFQQVPEAIAILGIAAEIVFIVQVDLEGQVPIRYIIERFMGGHEDMLNLRIGPSGVQIGFEPVVQFVADSAFAIGAAGFVTDIRLAVIVLIQDHEVAVFVLKGIGGFLAVGRAGVDDVGKAFAAGIESAKGGDSVRSYVMVSYGDIPGICGVDALIDYFPDPFGITYVAGSHGKGAPMRGDGLPDRFL
jgi:hypothetical protein